VPNEYATQIFAKVLRQRLHAEDNLVAMPKTSRNNSAPPKSASKPISAPTPSKPKIAYAETSKVTLLQQQITLVAAVDEGAHTMLVCMGKVRKI
jgi:hypothetical protein